MLSDLEANVNLTTNHLVDVYPQGVGCCVDISAGDVNDTAAPSAVHLRAAGMWLFSTGRPQAWPLSVLGCSWLSPESTDAMTTDEPSYSTMANCTSTSRAWLVDGHGYPPMIEENR
jgi:hypothetical protein